LISSTAGRLDRLRILLKAQGLDALVVFSRPNCRYLTGFTGEAGAVIVAPDEVVLITDSRYTIQAVEQAPGSRVALVNDYPDDPVAFLLAELVDVDDSLVVGFECEHLSVKRWEKLQAAVGGSRSITMQTADGLVERCRAVKTPAEVDAIRMASVLTTRGLRHLERMKVVGRSEQEVALELETWLRRNGSDGIAFPFIVASGARAAKPHAEPSPAVIGSEELVVVDMGACVHGYASDITRTYCTGPVDRGLEEAYHLVLEAQKVARAAVRPGLSCRELDLVARDFFEQHGKGQLFGHGLGHGVGLEVHEAPHIGSRSDDVLEEGMVVTIEPGLYLPDKGGIRIEDTVLVGKDRGEVLTLWPRELRRLR
jgi:Xaa-Pro aminopeptidase